MGFLSNKKIDLDLFITAIALIVLFFVIITIKEEGRHKKEIKQTKKDTERHIYQFLTR